MLPFTAIAFVWFAAALRDRFVGRRYREHTLLATVHLLSAARQGQLSGVGLKDDTDDHAAALGGGNDPSHNFLLGH